MFEFIRTHQRLMQFLLLLLIFPAFAFWGINGFDSIVGAGDGVAKVCGVTLTQQDYARAQQEYLDNMRQQLGANFRAEFFDNNDARNAILGRLVNQRALTCVALKHNMVAPDEVLRRNISNTAAFQVDGKFSKAQYDARLIESGYTPQVYDNLLRQQLPMQALSSGVLLTGGSPQTVQDQFMRAQEELREVQELLVKPDQFTSQVKLAADAAKKYYDANQREFEVPPQMRADYVVLSVDTLAAGMTADATEVRKFYDQNQAKYGVPEERKARHILISVPAGAPAAEVAKAQAEAEDILKQVKADPGKFAELAKKYSKDPGSAEKGGELDFARKDGSFVKPFEDALFSLKENEISGLVKTDYGFHIIQLLQIHTASIKPFEQVRGEIEADWKKQHAQKLYADSLDGFSDIVYTQPDSLKPAADKYKLTVQSTQLFSQANPPKELANPKLLGKLFSDDALKNKHNTEAVEVSPGVMVSAHVAEYKPKTERSFAEVQAGIIAKLTEREAEALAQKDGEAKLKQARADAGALTFGAAKTVSRVKPEGIGTATLKLVMAAPKDKLPVVVGGPTGDGSYGLYRINKVSQPDKPDPAMATQIKSMLDRAQAEADFNAYLAALKRDAKIELHPENIPKAQNN
ncbi:MAG TPA: SurA N-terminal domain-containing protein [Burkholderiales bacterium]